MFNNMKYIEYDNIFENRIILDFSGCKTPKDIHTLFKNKFAFPDYYGENWSALFDCLDWLFYDEGEIIIEIHNFNSLSKEGKEYCQPMKTVFEDVRKNTPNVTFKYIS